MPYSPGEIVLFESAVAGKMKFHLCICVSAETDLHSFIFLNSEGGFRDQFEIDCARIPDMQESRTGKTVFDCPTIHRKTGEQLKRLRARKVCDLPKDVAEEFITFAQQVTAMTSRDREALIEMLVSIVER